MKPIAVLGGTFDPVHNAHLAIARRALEALDPEYLLWVPTGTPGYRQLPAVEAGHRMAMLQAAIKDDAAGDARYRIYPRELAPGHSGYTYDTMKELAAENPGKEFILVMGGDQYEKRETWHRWADLTKLCRIAVVERPGASATGGDAIRIPMPPMAVSGSEIRARIARGEDVSGLVPAPVLNYIQEMGLYH